MVYCEMVKLSPSKFNVNSSKILNNLSNDKVILTICVNTTNLVH
jgi:hypothetical protein